MTNKLTVSSFLMAAGLSMVFSLLLVFRNDVYEVMSVEDSWIENLNVLLLTASGIYLLMAGFKHRHIKKWKGFNLPSILLWSCGIIMLIGAGEEISWGQRIFNFGTPDWLLEANDQKEMNFHNTNKKLFDRLLNHACILMVAAGTLFYALGSKRLIKLPVPDAFLSCAFFIMLFYREHTSYDFHFISLGLVVIILGLAIWKKDRWMILAVVCSMLITWVIAQVHVPSRYYFEMSNSTNEFREFLFSLNAFFYALVIYKDAANVPNAR